MNKVGNTSRVMGIDYGSKRIGIAISDENQNFALPLVVIKNDDLTIPEIQKIIKDNNVSEIVIGESRNYKGEANTILLDSLEFKRQLELLGYSVHLEPEFMTSVQAERWQGKNDMLDASAGAIILQSYLDKKKNSA